MVQIKREATQANLGTIGGNEKTQQIQNTWVASDIVPETAPKFNADEHLSFLTKNGAKVKLLHEYHNKADQLLGYTARIEKEDGKKEVMPVAWCHNEAKNQSRWNMKGFYDNGHKPIYGLDKLSREPLKPVLIVEGEKTADRAQKLMPDHNVISWLGGAQGMHKVDWSNLKHTEVTIWPDNDKNGIIAANKIQEYIDNHNGFSGMVSIVDTKQLNLPEKWDLADKLPEHLVDQQETAADAVGEIIANTNKPLHEAEKAINASNAELLEIDTRHIIVSPKRDTDNANSLEIGSFASKDMYKATLGLIASKEQIDMSDQSDYAHNMCRLQDKYAEMQNEQGGYLQKLYSSDSSSISQNKVSDSILRDTVVLHTALQNRNELPKLYIDTIKESVMSEVGQLKQLNNTDIAHAAGNIFKETTSNEWFSDLNQKNQDQCQELKLKFNAKTIDEFLEHDQDKYANELKNLEHIRKYGVDEQSIFKSFKEEPALGIVKLREQSEGLSKAENMVKSYSSIIDEARGWSRSKIDDIELTKALACKSESDAKMHCIDLRDNYLSKYIDKNLASFARQKDGKYMLAELRPIVESEQTFLKDVYETTLNRSEDETSGLGGKRHDALESGKFISEKSGSGRRVV